MIDQHPSIFTQYTSVFQGSSPLKEYPLTQRIIDILGRQEHHHILLISPSSEKMHLAIAENIIQKLTTEITPKSLRECDFIYLDIKRLKRENKEIEDQDYKAFHEKLETENKKTILIFNQIDFLTGKGFRSILSHEKCRVIVFTHPTEYQKIRHELSDINDQFTALQLPETSYTEALAVLKPIRTELENFHHIILSDDTLPSALSIASHYLSGTSVIDKACELLDSTASRISTLERGEQADHKPVVTAMHLLQTASNWTKIPLPHLQHNKFHITQLTETLKRTIFGQDAAINKIGSSLQQACLNLQKKSRLFCSFLLVGADNIGKSETALALAEYLFGHKEALLRINPMTTHKTLSDIRVTQDHFSEDSTLLASIQKMPYAIVLLENIEHIPTETIRLFKEILAQGYVVDKTGTHYSFHHTILIMTTTVGSEKINRLTQTQPAQDAAKQIDLLQLVLNENLPDTSHPQQVSPQDLHNEIMPELKKQFAQTLLGHLNIIPFVPLDYPALEKTIRSKIKILAKQLDSSLQIELQCAPEVIKFLAHEAFWQKPGDHFLDQLLEQYLYSCVSYTILARMDDKTKSNRLLLQLNDNGHALRCEFVTSAAYTG